MSEKDETTNAAERAWDSWHNSIGAVYEDDDDIPAMSPLWRIAFTAGAAWEKAKGEK